MAANLNGGFKVTSRETIDTRIVLSKAQMKSERYDPLDETSLIAIPNNYFCLCTDDNKLYVFNSLNTVDETTGRFRQVVSGTDIDEYVKSAMVDENGNLVFVNEHDEEVVYELKTINGEKLTGTGDISVNAKQTYHDLTKEQSVSLDENIEAGVYKIKTATDNPENTSRSGYLVVNELDNDKVEQYWYSKTNYAHRIVGEGGDSPVPTDGLYVNGVKAIPDASGTVSLDSGEEYYLTGILTGQVNIVGKTNTVTGEAVRDYTTIILAGVDITSSTASAILSSGEESRIMLEVREGTENVLESTYNTTNSDGVMHAEADMYLSGTGSLRLISAGGHGLKAKDTLVSGKPNIYIDAGHDAMHTKSLHIAGGTYYIKHTGADAFSAGSANNDGLIKISGGEITVEQCTENVFQAKDSDAPEKHGIIRIYYDTKINLLDGFSNEAVANAYSVEIYPTVTITKPENVSINGLVTIAEKYGTPTVYDEDNRMAISAVNNVFDITSAGATYTLSGNFTGYRIIVRNVGKSLVFNGVYLNDDSDDENPFIDYVYNTPGQEWKNVKLVLSNGTTEDKISYLKKNKGWIVRSTNNININDAASGSADIYMSCANGYCMEAGNEARIQNDGARYFVNSKYGVKANLVNCADELASEGYDKVKTAMVYFDGNTEYDIGVFHHAYKGEERDGRVNVTANCYCAAYLGKVVKLVPEENAAIYAEIHTVAPNATAAFQRYPFVYANENDLEDINNNVIIIGASGGPEDAETTSD